MINRWDYLVWLVKYFSQLKTRAACVVLVRLRKYENVNISQVVIDKHFLIPYKRQILHMFEVI